jgi:preprotein translocase subunit SecD
MKIRWNRFNIYLAVALSAAAVCGCRSPSESIAKKRLSTLRFHLQASRDAAVATKAIPVYRQQPFMLNVEKAPCLNESNVSEAKVVDVVGGFALRIQFDHAGTTQLEEVSTVNRGKRIAVFSQFGENLKEFRWLAAPVISRRITDGVFIFTPDATREEAEEIALGLNNTAKKTHTWIDK